LVPLWLNTTVPRWLNEVRPDVVHFTKVAVPRRKQYPTVANIHDVIPLLFPESQKLLPRISWPATLRHTARSADHILTISEASKRDIVEYLQVAPEKVTATPLAINHSLNFAVTRTAATTPYIFFVGTIEPRKNVPALVRAFAKIAAAVPHRLLIAGRPYKGIEEVRAAIAQSGVPQRIEVRSFVPKEELNALYANADLFVWPSLYEGWGFPPQEAMASGTPVIVSNGGSLPEVVGDAGEVVSFTVDTVAARTHDEAFEAALAERMLAVLTDPGKQSRMREAGIKQAQKNSWAEVARATLAVYEKVTQEN
jgi:glycosyltransferase involved in cell wall biosynthesis